jgi:hypothetical protein
MMGTQFYKGQTCKVIPVLCQEGYCSECYIYQKKFSRLEKATRQVFAPAYAGASTCTAERETRPLEVISTRF